MSTTPEWLDETGDCIDWHVSIDRNRLQTELEDNEAEAGL